MYTLRYYFPDDNRIYPAMHGSSETISDFDLPKALHESTLFARGKHIYFLAKNGSDDILLAIQNGELIVCPEFLREKFRL